MDKEDLVKQTSKVANAIRSIIEENNCKRQQSKENFNFFSAIVSGKHDKAHLEKHHSNFIAYLLNSKANHDFKELFLLYFIKEIQKQKPLDKATESAFNNLPNLNINDLSIERERPTNEGRLIDISLEFGSEWIIFIENKLKSNELEKQMSDYFLFAKNFSNRLGIYLTLNGDKPPSSNEAICMSYDAITSWINACCKDPSVMKHQHVTSALQQYLSVISNIKNTMKEDTKNTIEYLQKNKIDTEVIFRNWGSLAVAVEKLAREIRENFKEQLQSEVNKRLKNNNKIPDNLEVIIIQGEYLFTGNEEKYGLGYEVYKNKERFVYGGVGFGGAGNGIKIDNKNAHEQEGINITNAILLKYSGTEEWGNIIISTTNDIMVEVESKVLKVWDAIKKPN